MKRPFAYRLSIAVAALPLLAALPARAQEAPGPVSERPRIGLVLSGGGARGLAHIGVLRVLEEMRVPVDVVAGTSMGAIVGGLYAAGLSPAEMEFLTAEAEWDEILDEVPARGSLDFRRKSLAGRYTVDIELGASGQGLQVPGGLIAGQELGLLLRRQAFRVSPVRDFSRLPIPYAAVATDFEHGDRVVLDRGDLPLSMRASMAMPLVFSPVEVGDRVLVDGGIVNNMPVDVARAMGADVVVAVDATPPLREGEAIRTLLGAIDQFVALLARQDLERQRADADIVIDPDLAGIGLFEFHMSDSIVARGAAAARARTADLSALALSPSDYEEWRTVHRAVPHLPVTIDEIRIEGPPWFDERRARSRIELASGDPLDVDRLEAAAQAVYAIGEFERVEYDVAIEGGRTIAVIRAVAPPMGANSVRLGAHLVTESGVADFRTALATFQGAAGFERLRLNSRGGVWRVEVLFGQTYSLSSELDQPLDFAGRYFLAPRASISHERQRLFVDEDLAAEYEVSRAMVGADAGLRPTRWAELRAGLRWGWIDADVTPGPEELLPAREEDNGAAVLTVTLDRLDDADFPRAGTYARAELIAAREALGSDVDYELLEIQAKAYRTSGGRTGFVALSAGSALGGGLPAYDEFRLGGFLSLSGYGPGELRGAYYGLARTGGYVKLATLPPTRGVYAVAWLEAGEAWARSGDVDLGDLRPAVTAGLSIDTILGPISAAYGRARDGRGRIYIAVGPLF